VSDAITVEVPEHLTVVGKALYRALACYVQNDQCRHSDVAGSRCPCRYCVSLQVLIDASREAAPVDMQKALADLAMRLERQERQQERFRQMGQQRDADGCGRAISELVTFRSALESGFKQQPEDPQAEDDLSIS